MYVKGRREAKKKGKIRASALTIPAKGSSCEAISIQSSLSEEGDYVVMSLKVVCRVVSCSVRANM